MDVNDERPDLRREPSGEAEPKRSDPGPPATDGPESEAPASPASAPVPPASASAPSVPEPVVPAPGQAPDPSAPSVPAAGPGGALPGLAGSGGGIAALGLPYRIAAGLALAAVAVAAGVHLGMVFLHIAPANTVTRTHGRTVDQWIYPEFEQNWKLFAPNPLQQNIDVQVRAEVDTGNGDVRTTGWYDLSALDGAAIKGNLLPSHTQQNELRRAWDLYVSTHDGANRAVGLRGTLSEDYLRRLAALRLDRGNAVGGDDTVTRVQVRSRTTEVPPPPWSTEQASATPSYRLLPWWALTEGEWKGVHA
ncbi:DUF5819 family protein [Streptomyces nodosus]